jgi:hypothetical protein
MGRACSTNVAKRILGGKPEGRRPLGTPRCRWMGNIVGWDGMDWVDLAQDRDQRRVLVNTVM